MAVTKSSNSNVLQSFSSLTFHVGISRNRSMMRGGSSLGPPRSQGMHFLLTRSMATLLGRCRPLSIRYPASLLHLEFGFLENLSDAIEKGISEHAVDDAMV